MTIDIETGVCYVEDALFDQFPNSPISRLLLDNGMGGPDSEGPSQSKIQEDPAVKKAIEALALSIIRVVNGPSIEEELNDILDRIYLRDGHDFKVRQEDRDPDEPDVPLYSYTVPADADFVNCIEEYSKHKDTIKVEDKDNEERFRTYTVCDGGWPESPKDTPAERGTVGIIPVQDDRGHRRCLGLYGY